MEEPDIGILLPTYLIISLCHFSTCSNTPRREENQGELSVGKQRSLGCNYVHDHPVDLLWPFLLQGR
jgi:hypothetical protein